jgi:outer membrane lipoprotein-sorting protein
MSHHGENEPIDRLERATEALRGAPVADGPPPQVVAATVRALQSLNNSPDAIRLSQRRSTMFRVARYGSLAAAALLAALVAGWLLLPGRMGGTSFAGVIEKVNQAKSVTCVLKQKMADTVEPVRKLYIREDAIRMEVAGVGTFVFDMKQRKAIALDERSKTVVLPSVEAGVQIPNPLAQLRKLKQQDAERIGEEMLDGRKVEVYRLKNVDLFEMKFKAKEGENLDIKLWVDSQTHLPAKLVVAFPIPKADSNNARSLPIPRYLEFSDFRWDEKLAPSLFSLEIPKGYTLRKAESLQPKSGDQGPPKVSIAAPKPAEEESIPIDAHFDFSFAEVIENVNRTGSVEGQVLAEAEKDAGFIGRILRVQGDVVRREILDGRAENAYSLVEIADARQGKALQLRPLSKTAYRWDLKSRETPGQDLAWRNPAALLRNLKGDDAEWLRAVRFKSHGFKLAVYRLKKLDLPDSPIGRDLDAEALVYVEVLGRLPVEIRLSLFSRGTREVKAWCRWEHLEWNKATDPALFKLDVPEGYKVVERAPTADDKEEPLFRGKEQRKGL